MKNLRKIFRVLVCIFPPVLFFSYYPLISLGSNESMNFELSLPLVLLVIFDLVAAILIIRERKIKEIFKNYLYLLLPLFLTGSIFWSLNKVRGILTVGIFWLLYFAGFAIFILRDYLKDEKFKKVFFKVFFGSAAVFCVWCFLQSFLDVIGVSREYSLMCAGCTYRMFGFPHSNGFAIEPQFMGNLLLAPAIMSIWFLFKDEGNSTPRGRVARARRYGARALILGRNLRKPLGVLLPFIFVATLFLTFSRGAIYAFIVAMIFMTAFLVVRTRKFKPLIIWSIIIVAFLFTLNVQGIMAQVSPTDDTYFSGVSKVLNHLSLGIIDLKKPEISEETQVLVSEAETEEAVFSGYVPESTDTRLRLSQAAIRIWSKDFRTILFGVGIGGAGQALYENGDAAAPKEITQNQYTSLLLEAGLMGILLLILTLVLVLRFVVKNCEFLPILTLGVAYGITLIFFSGLPNALQIYLLPAIFIAIFYQHAKR